MRAMFIVVALASVASSVGCVGAAPVDETSGELTNLTAFANDKAAYDFFVGKGLTNFQAAGIVGNLDQESGVDPGAVQFGGGPGRGIAQWSVGGRWDTSANDNVLAYAKTKGESSGSLNLQLEFIWYELTSIGYGYAQLKATSNVTDATVAFMDKYEICGTCDQTQRVAYAKSVLAAYGAAPDWSASFVSQTWPYASAPAMKIKCGQSVAAKLLLKNTGARTWNASTKLGTTMKRDRASIFAGSDWLSPSRAAAVSGTVAPNADGTFAFSFHGPTGAACVPGTYHEYFGVVQEGVAWFSDNGQGGPPDDQIEALIELVPGDPTPDMGGVGGGGAGGSGGGGGAGGDNGGGGGGSGGGDGNPANPGNPEGGGGNTLAGHGGCAVGGAATGDGVVLAMVLAGLGVVSARRRRRSGAKAA